MRKRILALVMCLLVLSSLMPASAFAGTNRTPLKIEEQPRNVRGQIGDKVTVALKASGDGLQYTWYIRNPGSEVFVQSKVKKNVYSYYLKKGNSGRELYCVVSDRYGNSVTSKTVNVSTPIALKILKQPKDIYASVGDKINIKVSAQGDGLKYRWCVFAPGAKEYSKTPVTKATYTWKATKETSGQRIFCVIADAYGNHVRTEIVTLRVGTALQIKKQPTHVGAAAGQRVTTGVTAVGDGLKYRWYIRNPGSDRFVKTSMKGNEYSFVLTKGNSGRQAYCVITDAYGNKVKTDTVTLKIPVELKIKKQPTDVLTKLGTLGSTTVKAVGDGLRYRWYIKRPGETKFTKTTVTARTYSLNMSKEDVGCQVYCVVADMFGNKTKTKVVTFAAAKAVFDRTLYKVKPGAKRTVDLEIQPAGTKDEIIWTSSNSKIAKVNNKGVITGVKNGTVTITARGKNTGFIASCTLKVCNVKQVAITFDDGPGKYTAELLDFLKENDIRVTFFLVGNRLSSYKNTLKQMASEGHEIGYHSWKHDIQTKLSSKKIASDFKKANKLLKGITGVEFTLWRTPGGGYSDRVLKQIDLPHIMWSVDTLDWKHRDSRRVWNVIKKYSKDGSIVLLHDIHGTTIKGSMKALKEMQEGDYEFLTVTELLKAKGKTPQPNKTYFKG